MTANKVYDINIMEEYGQENERVYGYHCRLW